MQGCGDPSSSSPPTFLLLLQLHDVLSLDATTAAALLARGGGGGGGRDTERALAHKGRAAGVEGGRDAALLLPPLLPLQAGGEGAAHSVAQSLPLVERRRTTTTQHNQSPGDRWHFHSVFFSFL